MSAYRKRLTSDEPAVRLAAARAWTTWEMSTSYLKPKVDMISRGEDDKFALAFARIENHYFTSGGKGGIPGFFPTDSFLLENVHRIRHIPTFFVQGRYDVVCPMRSAFDLSRAFPEAEFVVCGESGHSAGEAETTSELVMACDKFADL